jgi:DNA-binding transcriptional MerR regulator
MKNFSMKKLYYSISEVSRITDLEQYVLRYWETEFDLLQPAKNSSGNRIYTNKDIKLILFIKKLLKEEKYTIEGAKKILKNYNLTGDDVQSEMDLVEKNKKSELSLFDANSQESEEGEEKKPDDLIEIKKFLEDLYSQIDEVE